MNTNILTGIVFVLFAILLSLAVVILRRRRPKTIDFKAIVEASVQEQTPAPRETPVPQRTPRMVIPPGKKPDPAPDATQLLSGGGSPNLGEHLLRDDRDSAAAARSVQRLTPVGGQTVPAHAKETVFLLPPEQLTQVLVSLADAPRDTTTRIPQSPQDLWKYLNALSQSAGRPIWVCLTIQWFDAEGESQVFCTLEEIPAYRVKAEKPYSHPRTGIQVPAFVLKSYKIVELDARGQLVEMGDRAIVQEQINLLAIPMARGRFPKVSEEMLRSLLPEE